MNPTDEIRRAIRATQNPEAGCEREATEPGVFWFAAKRRGWGFPVSWQGWVVLLGYCGLIIGGIPLIRNRAGNVAYVEFVVLATAVFLAICFWKGEPPRAR